MKDKLKIMVFIFTLATIIFQGQSEQPASLETKEALFKTINIQNLEFRPYEQQAIDGRQFWNQCGKNLLTYQETSKPTGRAKFDNGILGAFLEAYNNHGDVKIIPDDIWITIMIYFSKYVSDNPEQLKSSFVKHGRKIKLVVTTGNDSSESEWDQFFTKMSSQIREHTIEGIFENLESDFSTTGRLEKIVSTAAIMNTFKEYFDYGRFIPACGINNIHFGGTIQDWEKLLKKLFDLQKFDYNKALSLYIQKVSYILQKFIQTYQGTVDLEFWNNIINKEVGSIGSGSTTYFSGWLINLFGYYQKTDQVKLNSIGFDIEIENMNTGIVKDIKFVGGFKGVSKQGQTIRPHLSMAIIDARSIQEAKELFPYCQMMKSIQLG